jgi:hypothetical protein
MVADQILEQLLRASGLRLWARCKNLMLLRRRSSDRTFPSISAQQGLEWRWRYVILACVGWMSLARKWERRKAWWCGTHRLLLELR